MISIMAENDKTFTQEELNGFIAAEKKTWQKTMTEKLDAEKAERLKLNSQLEELANKAKLTDEEKSALEAQFEETRSKLMTAEEQAALAADKLKKEAAVEREKLTSMSQLWQNRYTESTISQSITSAAIEHNAYNPVDIVSFLRPTASIVELTDDKGKPIGQFATKIKMKVKEEDKEVEKLLDPSEALKAMRDNTERYGYLFKDSGKGGAGDGSPAQGSSGEIDWAKMDQKQYEELRKAGKVT